MKQHYGGIVEMRKIISRITPFIAMLMLAVFVVSACASEAPRVLPIVSYTPMGGSFVINYNPEDLRRQVKCSLTFEIIDEDAAAELESLNYRVRYSVLAVLSELTIAEITVNRDLDEIAHRIVERVNNDLPTGEDIKLVMRAFITEWEIL